jgi:NTP pyrophosphatase (non-canonical NTP hydrolase)
MHSTNTPLTPINFPSTKVDRSGEVMDILQEECAEVIQAVSKIRRFGLDNYKNSGLVTNRSHLEEEIGDLQCMIDLLIQIGVVDKLAVNDARLAKAEKLKKWSDIFTVNSF